MLHAASIARIHAFVHYSGDSLAYTQGSTSTRTPTEGLSFQGSPHALSTAGVSYCTCRRPRAGLEAGTVDEVWPERIPNPWIPLKGACITEICPGIGHGRGSEPAGGDWSHTLPSYVCCQRNQVPNCPPPTPPLQSPTTDGTITMRTIGFKMPTREGGATADGRSEAFRFLFR